MLKRQRLSHPERLKSPDSGTHMGFVPVPYPLLIPKRIYPLEYNSIADTVRMQGFYPSPSHLRSSWACRPKQIFRRLLTVFMDFQYLHRKHNANDNSFIIFAKSSKARCPSPMKVEPCIIASIFGFRLANR